MSDMSNLYRAYSAVHSSEVSDQLSESRDLISDMQFNQLNSSDLQEVAEEILEEMFELSLDIEQSSDIIADILSESLKTSQSDLKSQKINYIGEAFDAALENGHTVERFLGYRRSKKIQENFHNTSNEDRSSKRLHEALIAQERKAIKEGILSLIEKKTKDSSYLETNMEKRKKNNEKARKDMEKMGSMKNPQLEEFSQIRQDWSSAYSSIYEKMDPVGKEDGDIDNDGDKDSSDDYLAKRRKAIGKAIKGKMKKEELEHLDEISKKLARSYVEKGIDDQRSLDKKAYAKGTSEEDGIKALEKIDKRDKGIGMAHDKLYKGTPNEIERNKKIKVTATGKDPAHNYPKEKSKGIKGLVKRLTRKEELESLRQAYLSMSNGGEQLDEISKKLARSYVDKATVDRDKNAKDWKSTSSGEAFNKAERREKNIQRASSKLYKGTPAGKIMGTGNPAKVSATGKDPAEPKEKSKGIKGLVKTLNKANEEVQQVDEAITSEKGKAKMKSMIDARTTDSGRAKSGKGQNVNDIKHIGRANVDGYGGTPPNLKVAKNPVKSNFTGLNSGTGNKAAKRAAALKKEEVTFSESELEAIQAKVDAWDVEEGYQRNPEKGEAQARKSETSGQKTERNVRDRLKTMDPKKAEAMKKQMRAVGLSV